MAEPRGEPLVAKIVTELEAIVADGGTTYWYTPKHVTRAEFNQAVKWSTIAETFYEIRVGDVSTEIRTTGQRHTVRMEIFVTAATKDRRFSTNPEAQDAGAIQPATAKFRLGHDVKRKLAEWTGWGGLGLQLLEPTDDEQDVKTDGWAAVHLRFSAEFVERYAA